MGRGNTGRKVEKLKRVPARMSSVKRGNSQRRKGVDWQMARQSEIQNKRRMYDLMEMKIVRKDRNVSLYFDITECLGKF
jgi:hypothetical protein